MGRVPPTAIVEQDALLSKQLEEEREAKVERMESGEWMLTGDEVASMRALLHKTYEKVNDSAWNARWAYTWWQETPDHYECHECRGRGKHTAIRPEETGADKARLELAVALEKVSTALAQAEGVLADQRWKYSKCGECEKLLHFSKGAVYDTDNYPWVRKAEMGPSFSFRGDVGWDFICHDCNDDYLKEAHTRCPLVTKEEEEREQAQALQEDTPWATLKTNPKDYESCTPEQKQLIDSGMANIDDFWTKGEEE